MRTIALWLALILIFVIPWEEAVSFSGLGTVGRVTGLAVAGFWALTVAFRGRFRKPRPFHFVVLLFFLWNAVSTIWSIDPGVTLSGIDTYLQMAGFILILWDLFTTDEAVMAGLQAYVLGAYVSAGSTISNYIAGTETSYLRFAATGFQADTTALILALGLPAAWHLAASGGRDGRNLVRRLVNYAYIPVGIFAISLTATRFGLLAALPTFLFGLTTFGRLKPFVRVLIFVALAAALFVLPSIIPQSSLARLATTTDEISTGSLSGRGMIWEQGLAVFPNHPVLGVGGFAFPAAIEAGRSAHNSFLAVLVELGLIGLVLFGIVLVMTLYYALHQPKWESRFWLTVLAVWLIGNLAMTWSHKKPTWLFLSLVVVAANGYGRPVESASRSRLRVQSSGLLGG